MFTVVLVATSPIVGIAVVFNKVVPVTVDPVEAEVVDVNSVVPVAVYKNYKIYI